VCWPKNLLHQVKRVEYSILLQTQIEITACDQLEHYAVGKSYVHLNIENSYQSMVACGTKATICTNSMFTRMVQHSIPTLSDSFFLTEILEFNHRHKYIGQSKVFYCILCIKKQQRLNTIKDENVGKSSAWQDHILHSDKRDLTVGQN